MTFDMNDAEPQKSGDLIPDGTFAKITMTIRPGGVDGESEIDRGLLKRSGAPGSDVLMLDCEFTVAEGKTVIFVGILEKVTDDMGRATWQPQMEGGKAARELPGIVDQVMTLSLFSRDGDGWRHDPDRGEHRRLVCRAGNPFALPAKDRSGRLDVTEPPDLGALLSKINTTTKG